MTNRRSSPASGGSRRAGKHARETDGRSPPLGGKWKSFKKHRMAPEIWQKLPFPRRARKMHTPPKQTFKNGLVPGNSAAPLSGTTGLNRWSVETVASDLLASGAGYWPPIAGLGNSAGCLPCLQTNSVGDAMPVPCCGWRASLVAGALEKIGFETGCLPLAPQAAKKRLASLSRAVNGSQKQAT